MQKSDFNYQLPENLIAKHPAAERCGSRLLSLDADGQCHHRQFLDVLDIFQPGDLLVMNNSRVLKARLHGVKETGGKVELLLERILSETSALFHAKSSKSLKPGVVIKIAEDCLLTVTQKILNSTLCELSIANGDDWHQILDKQGELPLPPYMQRPATDEDLLRYQTVYAKPLGSVAAPTAGLHFDEFVLKRLQDKGVGLQEITLHVGAGTFLPVRTDDVRQHHMHAEQIEVSRAVCDAIQATKQSGGRVIAIGTTTLRALESAARTGKLKPFMGETDLFVTPGFEFQVVDGLLTNFHLPESTLLMLVCAFGGYESVMQAYQTAVAKQYAFYSYGDAMLLWRNADAV